MSTKSIEAATSTQEELIAAFLQRLPSMRSEEAAVAKETWREIIGTAPGDSLDEEAARLGAEWRAQMNQSNFG